MMNKLMFQERLQKGVRLYEHIVARIPFILISLGIILRVKRWLENRSLWLDEAYLGLHVMAKSWKGILLNHRLALDFPVPPMGFMLMEKINTTFFGNNEMALRLFPLCCGIAAIFLFYLLVKKVLPFRAVIFALALFVFNDYLIEYSSELKQYSTDLVVILGLSLLFLFKTDEHFAIKGKDAPLFAVAGMLAVTFSHSAIFILAAFGICQQIILFKEGRVDDAKTGVKVGFFWLLIFGCWYRISLSHMASEPKLIAAVKGPGYMINVPMWSLQSLKWFGDKIVDIVSFVAGLKPFFLSGFFCVMGIFSLMRRNKKVFLILFLPLVLAFCAGGLGRYLLGGRFSIFMVPAVLIGVVTGLEACFSHKGWKRFVAVSVCGGVFLFGMLPVTWQHYCQGQQKEEVRAVVRYFQENFQKQDALIINEAGAMSLWYYLGQNGKYQLAEYILMSDRVATYNEPAHIFLAHSKIQYDSQGYFFGYQGELMAEKFFMNSQWAWDNVKRLWVLGSHMKGSQEFIREYFFQQGLRPVVEKKAPGAMLMMYERAQ